MDKVLQLFADPANIAIIVAGLAVLRGVGELFEQIGKKHEGDDWFDSAGSTILKFVGSVGKLLSYFGVGNKQR